MPPSPGSCIPYRVIVRIQLRVVEISCIGLLVADFQVDTNACIHMILERGNAYSNTEYMLIIGKHRHSSPPY